MKKLREFLAFFSKKYNNFIVQKLPVITEYCINFFMETVPTFIYETRYIFRIFIIFFLIDQPYGQGVLFYGFGPFYDTTYVLLLIYFLLYFLYTGIYCIKIKWSRLAIFFPVSTIDIVSFFYSFLNCVRNFFFCPKINWFFVCFFKYVKLLVSFFISMWKPIFKKVGYLYNFFKKFKRF